MDKACSWTSWRLLLKELVVKCSAFHIVHVFSVPTGFFKSGTMLSSFLPLTRKLTWVEVFDSMAVDIINFSRLLPSLRFHVSSPDILHLTLSAFFATVLKIYTRLSIPSLWYLWGYLKAWYALDSDPILGFKINF